MERIERYLDQVCRGIGGSHKLRRHIRQELREHLVDAVAEHRAAGMTEEEAVGRALDDFGGPKQMREEFESLHGHRMMAVVIEKAIEWKEKTMKAKWLWTTWVYLALAITLALGAAFMSFLMIKVMPAYWKYSQEEWLVEPNGILSWANEFLIEMVRVSFWIVHYWYLLVLTVIVVWGLFEWRVRSENKTLIRLAALATIAASSVGLIALTSSAVIIQLAVALPSMHVRDPGPEVRQAYETLSQAVPALKEAMAKNDWEAIQEQRNRLSRSISRLSETGSAAPVLLVLDNQAKVEQLRTELKSANEAFSGSFDAVFNHDMPQLETTIRKFDKVYSQLREALGESGD